MRARNIKPGFYKNEDLIECSLAARLLAPGLWMMADRDGRLEDRPKRIKLEIFPCDNFDVNQLLDELASHKHITRYEVGGQHFIQINKFSDHQRPHTNEAQSVIPSQKDQVNTKPNNKLVTKVESPPTKVESTSPLTTDSLNPSSLNDDSLNAESRVVARAEGFREIYDAGSRIFPQLATANTSAIHAWIAAGCDPGLDVIPEIERAAKSGKSINSWKYFTSGIMDAKATRETKLTEGKPHANVSRSSQPNHTKPSWKSEGQRLADKYREAAELEEQAAAIGDSGTSLCIAESIRENPRGTGDSG